MKCLLNVTDHEYPQILQLTHDAVEWDNTDRHVLRGLAKMLGLDVVAHVVAYDECRIVQHDDVSQMPRVVSAPDNLPVAL